ncbi:hypothetical protein [Runella slithyformis]|uniref:Yip1 domain-containing protein n=1 Tax=Runella slithyformis (strain ATCC 29530 / DSM 19594 / LMG 11500 / NCIMB 11436 / LSU 4) TaxID=761193 RepID=A0A7U3ZKG2_RUNSL|nr:hypothetical protein [Runella slithyformis]AEI48875.1 hypothetical protein Runsl_2470 [Runella slithyformis DSM 19594]
MNNLYRFLLFSSFACLLAWVTKTSLISDTLYFNTLADQLTYEQIEDFIAQGKQWEWLGYVLIPLVYLIKFSLVALVLSLGLWLVTGRYEFKRLLGVAIEAEVIFLLPIVIKIFWFLFVQTGYTLQDLQFFYPLSALNLFDYQSLEPWLVYPLQVLNVFEVAYWVVLAYGVALRSPEVKPSLSLERAFGLVAASYGTGLVVWVAVMMFLTLSYS